LLALLLFRLRRRSLLHRLLRLRPGPRGVALRLDLLLALLPLKPALGSALLKMLLCYGLARLIAVILRSNYLLLLDGARIVVARILPLVNRWRRGGGEGVALPPVPSDATLLPGMAPVFTPARRPVAIPAAKINRRSPVVPHRNEQRELCYVDRRDQLPRAVVPLACVPVVSRVDPVESVVKEVVRIHLRVVID